MNPLVIPSPPFSSIGIGPVQLHMYALCILAGIIVAWWLASRRWVARGGRIETFDRSLVVAIIFGIVGARLYHVITDHQLYFGPGKNPWDAFAIWRGGLGIWGAVALGAVGAWLGMRGTRAHFAALADAVAPAILLAQGIGRLGNWFNQELFGRPLHAWWALAIDPAHRPVGYEAFSTFHPTFLYELVWNVAGACALLWLDCRLRLGHGKVFWAYVAYYTLGRLWIEHLRIDPAHTVGGFRLNEYTSIIVFLVSVGILVFLSLRRPGRETDAEPSVQDVEASADSVDRPTETRVDVDATDSTCEDGVDD